MEYLILRFWRPWWMLGPSQSHQCSGSRESQRVSLSLMSGYTGAESGAKTWELTVLSTILTPALLNWVLSYTPGLRRPGDQVISRSGWCWLGSKCPLSFTFLTIWLQVKFFIYGFLRPGGFSIIIIMAWVKWQKIL